MPMLPLPAVMHRELKWHLSLLAGHSTFCFGCVIVQERMRQVQASAPASTLYYPRGFKGSPEDRVATAHMLQRTFMKVWDVKWDAS